MAFKQHHTAVEAAPLADTPLQDIELEIEGLIASHDGTFTLRGIPVVNVDWPAVEDVLTKAGLPITTARVLVEDFAEKVGTHMIAEALAARTKRIG